MTIEAEAALDRAYLNLSCEAKIYLLGLLAAHLEDANLLPKEDNND